MPKIRMPEIAELGTQLGSLVGKDVSIADARGPNTFEDSCHTARYMTRDDRLVALCQVDLAVAAAMGASLAMIPASAAEGAVKNGKLDQNLTDAYREVANIMAALLCGDGFPHVRSTSVEETLDSLSDEESAILKKPASRIDVEVEFEGYGGGKMTIVAIDT
ncbi:MAG: hypothetical protein GY937_08255 [bacterium]|nr:hypothetical protein [bacterium]